MPRVQLDSFLRIQETRFVLIGTGLDGLADTACTVIGLDKNGNAILGTRFQSNKVESAEGPNAGKVVVADFCGCPAEGDGRSTEDDNGVAFLEVTVTNHGKQDKHSQAFEDPN